jgi:hypothetical protein
VARPIVGAAKDKQPSLFHIEPAQVDPDRDRLASLNTHARSGASILKRVDTQA